MIAVPEPDARDAAALAQVIAETIERNGVLDADAIAGVRAMNPTGWALTAALAEVPIPTHATCHSVVVLLSKRFALAEAEQAPDLRVVE